MCLSMHLYESNDRWSSNLKPSSQHKSGKQPPVARKSENPVVKRHKLHEDKIGHGPPELLTRFSKKQVTCYSVLWRQNCYEIFDQYPLCARHDGIKTKSYYERERTGTQHHAGRQTGKYCFCQYERRANVIILSPSSSQVWNPSTHSCRQSIIIK